LTVAAALACEEESASGPVSPPVSFSMNAVEGNGVTGTAQIDDQPGDVSTVTVTLQGLPAGGQHAGHVHRGSCANQGAILFGLMPIAADAQGNGTAFTNQVPDELLGVGFYLQYHVELEPPGDPISCADIPPREPPGIDY
jgi:hypothetical protein